MGVRAALLAGLGGLTAIAAVGFALATGAPDDAPTASEPTTAEAPAPDAAAPDPPASACPPGTWSATGDASAPGGCREASPGSFVAEAGAQAETPCPAGTYAPDAGATSCLDAPPGSFVPFAGAVSPTACAAGSFTADAGRTDCDLSPPGAHVPRSGMTSALPCPQAVGDGTIRCLAARAPQPPTPAVVDASAPEGSDQSGAPAEDRSDPVDSPSRDVAGTVRVVSGGAGAERDDVRVRILDVDGDPVAGKEATVDVTTGVDLGDGATATEATFTILDVEIGAQYRVAVDGPGVATVTSSLFELVAGETSFDPGRVDVQARTTVSGVVRGFESQPSSVVPTDLAGATITLTPEGGAPLPPLSSAGNGSFSVTVDAGTYDVTVAASGYATRTFSAVDLIGTAAAPSQSLQPTTAPFATYPGITGPAGQVGLVPSAREVRVDVDLDGAAGASRAARVELVGGTIGGVATVTPSHTATGTIDVDDATGTGRFTFAGVPAGAYTLNVVPTDGSGVGITHTAATVVVGPSSTVARLDVTTSAQAMSRLTGTVVGFNVFTMELEPLAGAVIAAPGAPSDATSGGDGDFSLIVRSGTYGTGEGEDFAAITVTPASSAYGARSVTGTVSALTGVLPGTSAPGELILAYPDLDGGSAGTVGVDPSLRRVEITVDLDGVDGSTQRDLRVRLIEGEVTLGETSHALTDVTLTAATSATVTAGTPETFSSDAVRPATYEVDIDVTSGAAVVLDALVSDDATTARVRQGSGDDAGKWFVDVQPGTSTVRLSATLDPGLPGAPTGVTVTVSGDDVTIEWTAPADDGGSDITGYIMTSSPVGVTCSTTSLSCTLQTSDFEAAAEYTFAVVATNANGTGPAGTSAPPRMIR